MRRACCLLKIIPTDVKETECVVRLTDMRNSLKTTGCDVCLLVKSKRPLSVRNKSSGRSGPAAARSLPFITSEQFPAAADKALSHCNTMVSSTCLEGSGRLMSLAVSRCVTTSKQALTQAARKSVLLSLPARYPRPAGRQNLLIGDR